MSNYFKVTLPDGTLKDYLADYSPKARNFELIRLATNALKVELNNSNVHVTPMVKNSEPPRIAEVNAPSQTISKPDLDDIAELEDGTAKAVVDFGSSLLSLAN